VNERRNVTGLYDRGAALATGAGAATEPPALDARERASLLDLVWGPTAIFLSVLYTIILAPFAALATFAQRGDLVSYVVRLWARLILLTCGIKVDIAGREHLAALKSYVMITNHQSLFDIVATIGRVNPTMRFVAKKELLRIPLIGFIMRHSGHVMIDRQSGGKSIRRALRDMARGYPLCVFAEGHRHADGRVHEFNDGGAWLAIASGLPCVPAAISGSAAFFPRGARIVRPGRRMRIAIGAPIATEGLRSADRQRLTEQLEGEVRELYSTIA